MLAPICQRFCTGKTRALHNSHWVKKLPYIILHPVLIFKQFVPVVAVLVMLLSVLDLVVVTLENSQMGLLKGNRQKRLLLNYFQCLGKFELFLHDQPEPTPVLLKVALANVVQLFYLYCDNK